MRKAPRIILITAAALIGTGTVLSCGAWRWPDSIQPACPP